MPPRTRRLVLAAVVQGGSWWGHVLGVACRPATAGRPTGWSNSGKRVTSRSLPVAGTCGSQGQQGGELGNPAQRAGGVSLRSRPYWHVLCRFLASILRL